MNHRNSNILKYLIIVFSLLTHPACAAVSSQKENTPAADENTQTSQSEPAEEPYLIYEAVFLDEAEVREVFRRIRGEEAPYEFIPKEYHITVSYLPESPSNQLYGSRINANGSVYKAGDVLDDKGNTTQNEGILVDLQSDIPEFRQLINSTHTHVWHITGSYSGKAKYTSNLDFSDGKPFPFVITGRFGGYMSDGTIRFTSEPVKTYADTHKDREVSPADITLFVWAFDNISNKKHADQSPENIQLFTELFDALYNQKESNDDILIPEKGYDSLQDGLLLNDGKSISFINHTIILGDKTYENAWYLELRPVKNGQLKFFILPEGSRYTQMLKQLLENMHYLEFIDEIYFSN